MLRGLLVLPGLKGSRFGSGIGAKGWGIFLIAASPDFELENIH